MLQSLTIKNVALISSLTVDFSEGLNIFLGETGAGKSIIFDSLNFVLGAKPDKTLIRYGQDFMKVDALFTNLGAIAIDALKEYGYEESEIVLSRSLSIDGKSTIRINGIATTLTQLRLVGQILVDSYSQHESVELLKSKNHLLMIDKFSPDIKRLKENVREKYNKLQSIEDQISSLGGDKFERERTKALLEYEVKQLQEANLQIGEDETIKQRRDFLLSSEKIFQAISICNQFLIDQNESVSNLLQQSSNLLAPFLSFENILECKNRLDSVRYEVEDIGDTLKDIKNGTEFDENELERLEARYDLIKSLTRRYGGSIEKTLEYLEEAKHKLMQLEDGDFILEKLTKEQSEAYNQLMEACEILSKERHKVAIIIQDKILKELEDLNMKSSKFKINFTRLEKPTINGFDRAEFEFSANVGQDVKSLAKTASGGELSRFMLAIKNIFAQNGSAQTLVFDEIDVGISGETGNVVGLKLNNITSFAQILCITHLPQVASYGDSFYYVYKEVADGNTYTKIENIKGKDIIYNLARLVQGDNVTEIALKHALEMRNRTGKSV